MIKISILAYGIICTLAGFLTGRYARRDRKPPVEQSPGTQTYSAEREAERIIMEAMR